MALEFNKVMPQLHKMSAMIEALDFDMGQHLHIARQRFFDAPDLEATRERVNLVRQSDISGYRGAAPLNNGEAEPINAIIAPPPTRPEHATILAADGSQVYTDEQAPVHYYLLNIGMFIYRYGISAVPTQLTIPELFYHKAHVHDGNGQVITNRTVDARRTLAEMQRLAEAAWAYRNAVQGPMVALYDNRLLFWAGDDVVDSKELVKAYQGALVHLHDSGAILAGYVDNPRGSVMLRLLYLMSLRDYADIKANERLLATGGDLEGLRDRNLFSAILAPGERSAIMVQNSPRNLGYKQRGVSYEIAFFYVRVGDAVRSAVARVDIPMWVARDKGAVDDLHALLLAQSTMQGRNPYPYALTRADELAYVSSKDKRKLDELINIELRRKGITPAAYLPKARGKELARSDRRGHELRSDLPQDHPF